MGRFQFELRMRLLFALLAVAAARGTSSEQGTDCDRFGKTSTQCDDFMSDLVHATLASRHLGDLTSPKDVADKVRLDDLPGIPKDPLTEKERAQVEEQAKDQHVFLEANSTASSNSMITEFLEMATTHLSNSKHKHRHHHKQAPFSANAQVDPEMFQGAFGAGGQARRNANQEIPFDNTPSGLVLQYNLMKQMEADIDYQDAMVSAAVQYVVRLVDKIKLDGERIKRNSAMFAAWKDGLAAIIEQYGKSVKALAAPVDTLPNGLDG